MSHIIIVIIMDNNLNEQMENSQESKDKYKIPNYKFTKTLGSGTFGKVKAAIHIPSGQNVAVKIIEKNTLKDQDDKERVDRQVQIMKSVRHPNIIQFYEMIETDEQIFLVVQYAQNGQLFRLMSDQVRLNERASGRIFIQLMNAVQYLHRLGIVHRDLKPQNILLDVDYNVKLTDFGLSNFSERGQFLHTACGSPCYAPPEMVSGNSYEGHRGDIWSLGIIFYGMICGSLPFQENTTKQLYKKVIEGLYFIPSDISLQATEVIRRMLVTNPKQRIDIPQLRKLKYFLNLKEIQPKIIGIIVGFHPMPIDNQILQKMAKIAQFDRIKVQDQIKQNQHTKNTTLYYLIQKQSLRNGNKTVVDLQYFLQSNERYKSEYGILPQECQQQLNNAKQNDNSAKTIKTIKNVKQKNRYTISNTKGLSKQRRQPIKLPQRVSTQNQHCKTERQKNTQRTQKAEKLFTTVRKYKLQKLEKSQEMKSQIKNNNSTQRPIRFKTLISSQKSKQKMNRSKSIHNNSSEKSNSRKKSQKKQKNMNKLAINLWNAYFEKPLQSTIKTHADKLNSGRGNKLKNKQKQHAQKTFNQNLQKLKEGFLKLPHMKKNSLHGQKNTQNTNKQEIKSPRKVQKEFK